MKFKILLIFLLGTIVSWGQVISWNFTSGNTPDINLPGGVTSLNYNTGGTIGTSGCNSTGFSSNGWNVNEYLQIAVSLAGYNITTLDFNARSSGTGPWNFKIQYSSTGVGGTFIDLGSTFQSPDTSTCGGFSFDFSSIDVLDNNADAVIRLVFTGGQADGSPATGDAAGAGTFRIDDLIINGVPTFTPDVVLNSSNPSVGASTIVQGEDNHVIYAFDLTSSVSSATLNQVVFSTLGTYATSNITNFKLWYSSDAVFDAAVDVFLDNETTGLGVGAHTFSGFSQNINDGTTGYFFITADIPCTATNDNNISVDAITIADLSFVSANKLGVAYPSEVHTIESSVPNKATDFTISCANGIAVLNWNLPTGCYDNVLVFATDSSFSSAIPTGNGGSYSPDVNFSGGSVFDGGYTVYKGSGTSVVITGLTNGNSYTFKIFSRNDLNWSDGVEVSCTPTIVYCDSGSTNSNDSEIENVSLTGENNAILNNTTDVCSTGVNDYTAMSADLEIGNSYTLTVEFGDCNNNAQFNGAGGVWIDWNNDGDFGDLNETIGIVNVNVSNGNVIENFTINVPGTQPIGFYRMRIVQNESASTSSISPCGVFNYGSTEDYTIEIITPCIPNHTINTISPTLGPVATVVTITGSGFTNLSQVYIDGVLVNTNFVNSTQLTFTIPNNISQGNKTIKVLENGCTVYSSTLFEVINESGACGSTGFSDIIISEVYDSNANNVWNMELYNPTDVDIDLNALGTDYTIQKFSDQLDTTVDREIDLTGIIPAHSVFTLSLGTSTQTCGGVSFNFYQNGAGINEEDVIKLTKNGSIIDEVFCPNEIGYSVLRNTNAAGPTATFNAADWSIDSDEFCSDLGVFNSLIMPSVTVGIPYTTYGANCLEINFTVGATAGAGGTLTYQWFYNAPGDVNWTALSNTTNFSGVDTQSLTIQDFSTLIDYQFYCQVTEGAGTCYVASNAISTFGSSVTTWNGANWTNGTPTVSQLAIIAADYDTDVASTGSFSCCSLLVKNDVTLSIQANDYVEVINNLIVNGNLTVLDDGSLVQVNDSGVNLGSISYERNTVASSGDYVYWATPVAGVSAPASGYIYKWNPVLSNPNGGKGYWVGAAGTTINPGEGVIMRDVFSTTFTGVPSNGVLQQSVSRADITSSFTGTNGVIVAADADNWNLLGNPYPSAINAIDFLLLNTNLQGHVNIWSHGTPIGNAANPFYGSYQYNYDVADYITYNGTGAISSPAAFDGYIAGGQGFFVVMNDGAATTETVTFNNSLRSKNYDNTQFYKISNQSQEKNRIWLDLVDSNANSVRTLIGYVENATDGQDHLFDCEILTTNAFDIFSLIAQQKMKIQGKSIPFSDNDTVPIGVNLPTSGNYSFAIHTVDGVFSFGQDIFIHDLQNGVYHNLKTAPYNFSSSDGLIDNRFEIVYKSTALDASTFDYENEVKILVSDVLKITSTKEKIDKIVVYNVLGQKLYQNETKTNLVAIESIAKQNQPILITISLENGNTITKKVIF